MLISPCARNARYGKLEDAELSGENGGFCFFIYLLALYVRRLVRKI